MLDPTLDMEERLIALLVKIGSPDKCNQCGAIVYLVKFAGGSIKALDYHGINIGQLHALACAGQTATAELKGL